MNFMKKTIGLLLTVAMLVTMLTVSIGNFSAAQTNQIDSSATASDSTAALVPLMDTVQGSVMLHAFCWSYNTIKENLPAIARAGYTTVQTSPVQQPKDYGNSMDTAGQWSKLYQPLSFSIAESSWLGTKSDLTSLCAEAEKYGIKIICDIVSNHLAQDGDTAGALCTDVANYEPTLFNNQSQYFHGKSGTTVGGVNDITLKNQVWGLCSGCPDLNTADSYVQSRVISLLQECIDCGVDGFRFDAAKHIETESDKIDDANDFSSDYWEKITTAAKSYYTDKTGKDLYIYGEILGAPGSDSKTGFVRDINSYTKYIDITDSRYSSNILGYANRENASGITTADVTFNSLSANDVVTWVESHDNYENSENNTSTISNATIAKAWAVLAAKKDTTNLYFARPGIIMGNSGDTSWKSTAVSEVNKFHNLYANESQQNISYTGSVAVVERGTTGAVLANFSADKSVTASVTNLADGVYTDAVSGNVFTVASGTVSGTANDSGIAVIYAGATTSPKAIISKESCSFKASSLSVTLSLENATSGTYKIDNEAPITFTNDTTILIGAMSNPGDTVTLTVTATDGTDTASDIYKYTKEATVDSGVFVYYQNFKGYATPYVYAYIEDEDKNLISQNHSWPGEEMGYDSESGLFYYEVTEDIANGGKIIFSDGGKNQYPAQTSREGGVVMENQSMIFSAGNKWQTYISYSTVVLGDYNLDQSVTINDVSGIQKYAIKVDTELTDAISSAADVNGDGVINVKDGTAVQKYLANIETPYSIGTRVPIKTATPETGDVFYVVDKTGWVFTYGANLWLYNEVTQESTLLTKESPEDDNSKYATCELDSSWTNLSIYRLPYSESSFSIDAATDSWTGLKFSPSSNSYILTGSGTGRFDTYDPSAPSTMVPKTIYFDNSRGVSSTASGWNEVYIYGWGESGLNSTFHLMTHIEGTNIWYYTFDSEFEAGSACIKFSATNPWSSTASMQTIDLVTESEYNMFVLGRNNGTNRTGTWSVFKPIK